MSEREIRPFPLGQVEPTPHPDPPGWFLLLVFFLCIAVPPVGLLAMNVGLI